MLIHADRPAWLVLLAPGQERFEIFLEILGLRIIDRDDDGEKRRDPLDPHLLGLAFQILFHVIQREDPDDVALPDIGQPLRAQDAVEGLVPGDIAEIDGHFPLDLALDEDILVDDPGQGAQNGLDVRLSQIQVDPLRREFLDGRGLLFLPGFSGSSEELLGHGDAAIPRRGRSTRLRFRHRGPFFERNLLPDRLIGGAAEDQQSGQKNTDRPPPRTCRVDVNHRCLPLIQAGAH